MIFLAPLHAEDSFVTVLKSGRIAGPIEVPASHEYIAASEGTVIVGPETGPAVTLLAGATIRGATIIGRDSSPLGAAVISRERNAAIRECMIEGGPGDGVLVLRGSIAIASCTIARSRIGVAGRRAEIALESSVIEENEIAGVDLQESSKAEVLATAIRRQRGDGVRIGAFGSVKLGASEITGNGGAGIREIFPGTVVLESVLMEHNAGGDRVLPPSAPAADPPPAVPATDSPAASPLAMRDAFAPLLRTIGFSPEEVLLPTDRIGSAMKPIRDALDSPLEFASRTRADAEALLGAATPESLLRMIAAWSRDTPAAAVEAGSLLRELMASAREAIDSIPECGELENALLSDDGEGTLLEEHVFGPETREETARLGRLAAAAVNPDLLERAADLAAAMRTWDSATPISGDRPAGLTGSVIAAAETPWGWFVVGDSGPNIYPAGIAVIIDAGGDDRYTDAALAESGVALVLDYGGHDRYEGSTCVARRGIAILIDLAGDDVYDGGVTTQAAAVGGVALLWDAAGNDRYHAVRGGQAFAVAGVAALFDAAGDDAYRMASYGQASSGPRGRAYLVDRRGNDHYTISGGASDSLRAPERTLSFGQAFSCGLRPGASGGVALLADGAGHDAYACDLFGQGSGYWASLAALYDGAGDDHYSAWHYVQGAGVHLAAGLLYDAGEGRDVYEAWTVAQGCGHDLALGVLEDEGGADLYRSDNLSQAAGSINGIGILFDRGGDDAYRLGPSTFGLGVGVFENSVRRFGSLGIFLDLGGADLYSGRGRDGTTWTQGEIGIGEDR